MDHGGITTLAVVALVFSLVIFKVDCVSYYGTQFNIGFFNSNNGRISVLIIAEKPHANVDYNITSLRSNYSYSGTVGSDIYTVVNLPSDFEVKGTDYAYRELGIQVTSTYPISVIGTISNTNSSFMASFLSYPFYKQPVNQYIYYGISFDSNNNQLLLIGTTDSTNVTIVPSSNVTLPANSQLNNSTLQVIPKGFEYNTTLHSLQSLLLVTAGSGDISSTFITSDQPLTVIGGQGYSTTQVPPTIAWSNHFLLSPLHNSKGQWFKIIASEPSTAVTYTCNSNLNSDVLLNASCDTFVFWTSPTQYCDLLCSQRCYVAEFSNDTESLLMTVPPVTQYPHNVTFTDFGSSIAYYSIVVPADEYFNGTVIVNGIAKAFNWVPIYNVTGSVTGYGYSSNFSGFVTIGHSHMNGSICVTTYYYNNITSESYGYVAGAMINPNIPRLRFSSEQYCAFEMNQADIVLERYEDLSVNFAVDVHFTSPTTGFSNSTMLEFSSGMSKATIPFSMSDYESISVSRQIDLAAELTVANKVYRLARATLFLQDNNDISLGFETRNQTLSELNTLMLDVIYDISELFCFDTSLLTITLLLQLGDDQGNTINISTISFNQYTSRQSLDISIDRLPFSLDFDTEGLLFTGQLIAIGTTQLLIDQSEVSIYNLIVPSSTDVLLPTQVISPDEVILNPVLAYVIGASCTIVTAVLCSYVIVASFCFGRFCCRKKRYSLDASEELEQRRPGHYTMTSTTSRLTNTTSRAGINEQRMRADSSRRPPPLPPSSRPLPALPSEAEVYENENFHIGETENKL